MNFGRAPRESRYVLREVLMAVWRRQGWPLRHMSFEHWDLLAAIAESSADSRIKTFPGGVTAENVAGMLRLRRVPTNERKRSERLAAIRAPQRIYLPVD
jgi:hypothetical protein